MNKNLLTLALLSSIGLAGCGGGGADDPVIPDGTAGSGGNGGVALTRPVYSPSTGQLPVPNDLLFNGSTDLTLNIPNCPTPTTRPDCAVTALDGWSAVAPFTVAFTNSDAGVGIDAASVKAGENVRLFKVTALRTANAQGIVPPTGPVTGVQKELVAGTDFRVDMVAASEDASKRTLRITPIKPFDDNASYVLIVTNGIQDTRGNKLIADAQFAAATTTSPFTSTSAFAALEPVRQLVNAMLGAVTAAGVQRDDVVLATQFTVQAIGDTLQTVAQVVGASPAPETGGFALKAPLSALAKPGQYPVNPANIHQGYIKLPYYLSAPSVANPIAPLNTYWKAPAHPLLGDLLTYVNKRPAPTGTETAPVLVSVPTLCGAKPEAGWPTVIFQHGITGNRTNALGLAGSMAAPPACMAVVAIDQPLHGMAAPANAVGETEVGLAPVFHVGFTPGGLRERTFGVDYQNNVTSATGPDGTPDRSGAHFINLSSPLTSRDNLRQTVADLLSLSKALGSMDVDGDAAPDFNTGKVYFVGHSLGAITGQQFASLDPSVRASVLANPGGGLGKMVASSPTFGPVVTGGLAALANIRVGSAGFESYLFLLQSVIDNGDPLANAFLNSAGGKPTLMFQVKGDTVVPNDSSNLFYRVPNGAGLPADVAANAPYAGTTPLARTLGLTTYTADTMSANGVRGFVKFNAGVHSSLLDPTASAAVTMEMQSLAVRFFLADGKALDVTNATVLEP